MKSNTLVALTLLAVAAGCGKKDTAPSAAASGGPAPGAAPASEPAAAAPSLSAFEGEIGLAVRTKDPAKPIPPMTLLVKGDRIRLDVPPGIGQDPNLGQAPRLIVKVRERRATAIIDERKVAMTLEIDKVADQARAIAGSTPVAAKPGAASPPKITRTGKVDTVAGYRCEEWTVASSDGNRAFVCMGNEPAPWLALPDQGLPADQIWARELLDGRHFPLRIVSLSAAGVEESRMEVTRIQRKSLADTLFDVPAGYQVVDMSNLAQMFKGMPTALPSGLVPGGAGMGLPPGQMIPPEAAAAMKRLQDQLQKQQGRAPK